MRARARLWPGIASRLEELRGPHGEHAENVSFERMTGLLADRGEVVTEAERRGWGLVGLVG